RADYIVSVPSSPNKEKYDVPVNISQQLSTILNMKNGAQYVFKTKDTQMKNMQTGKQKADHIRDAFSILPNNPFQNKSVIIIDDIYDSGATLNELGNVLRSAGAKVYGLTATKTFRDT
ncbi:MAG: hypothetical protein MUF38_17590, partial [Anaerolineae bacterium]|nr:hypothetical protein [Anaerolineae bacterium]